MKFLIILISIIYISAHPTEIKNILNKYCVECHGPDKQKGEIRFDTLKINFQDKENEDIWQEALYQVIDKEMPPKKALQLPKKDLKILKKYLEKKIKQAKNTVPVNNLNIRRLTNIEYKNTITDLFQISHTYHELLPRDIESKQGFYNNVNQALMTPAHLEIYWKNARKVINQIKEIKDNPSKKQSYIIEEVTPYPAQLLVNNPNEFSFKTKKFINNGVYTLTINLEEPVKDETLDIYLIDVRKISRFKHFLTKTSITGNKVTIKIKMPELIHVSTDSRIRSSFFMIEKQDKSKLNITSLEVNVEQENIYDVIFKPQHAKKDEKEYVTLVLRDFMQRAYRREIKDDEINNLMKYYTKHRNSFESIQSVIEELLIVVLTSPDFLYKTEIKTNPTKQEPVNSYELASRMSYFLWSSMPDEELMQLAKNNQLHDKKTLSNQVERMIRDIKINRFFNDFCYQWLSLENVSGVAIDPSYYPSFNTNLQKDMVEESISFFQEIFFEELSIINFIKSDFTIASTRLARHYRFINKRTKVKTIPIKIKIPKNSIRTAGLLTQGSFLLSTSTGADSHTVRRGVWISSKILNEIPKEPPANTVLDETLIPNFDKLSMQQKLKIHRTRDDCYNCHKDIDPLGIAVEGFDAIGKKRTKITKLDKDKNIFFADLVNEDTLPDGTKLKGVKSLQQYILKNKKNQFTRGFVEKLVIYSLGRDLRLNDQVHIDKLHKNFVKNDYKIKALIHDIILSDLFKVK